MRLGPTLLPLILLLSGCAGPGATVGDAHEEALTPARETTRPSPAAPSETLTVPTPLTPAEGARALDPRNVAFAWTPAVSSTGGTVTVRVLSAGHELCSSTGTSCTARLEAGQDYTWFLEARSSSGKTAQSSLRQFITNAPPARPDVRGLDGAVQVPRDVVIELPVSVDPDGEAVIYDLSLRSRNGTSISGCQRVRLPECEFAALRIGETYTGTVVARDVIGLESRSTFTFVTQRPVVLIHGYRGDNETWTGMTETLWAAGLPVLDFSRVQPSRTYNLDYPAAMSGGIHRAAQESVAPRIEEALRLAGLSPDQPIDLIGHSMGGLVARYVAEKSGEQYTEADYTANLPRKWRAQVATVITLGTPHRGSEWSFCFTVVCDQMSPGSDFLQYLGTNPEPTEKYLTFGGTEDSMVSDWSASLDEASHVTVRGAEHIGTHGIVRQPLVHTTILEYLGPSVT